MTTAPRRLAILSPTTIQFIEKMACLGPVHVLGPSLHDWNAYHRRADEWAKFGLEVHPDPRPYDQIDFSHYDVLIESYENFHWEPTWQAHCMRRECPIVLKACWTSHPANLPNVPQAYLDMVRRDVPVILEMPNHVVNWRQAGFNDVSQLFNPVGQWWFDRPWTGRDGRAVMVLGGRSTWREVANHGIDLFERLEADFPGRVHLHDGAATRADGTENYLTSDQMSQLLSGARVFLNFDRAYGQGERCLSLAFTEALSAGCPVAVKDDPALNYRDYVRGNGVASNDYQVIREFVGRCLNDLEFARTCSVNSKAIADAEFTMEVLRPRYAAVFERAKMAHEHR